MFFLQQVSPPSLILYITVLLFFFTGPLSFAVSYYGWRNNQFHPIVMFPLVLYGISAVVFSVSYSQLTIPWFPGYPIQSGEARFYFMLMGAGALSVPPTVFLALRLFTERSELYERLLSSEKERIREKEKFLEERANALTILGHEIRTPWAVMEGLTGVLLEILKGTDITSFDSMRRDIEHVRELAALAVDGGARFRVMLKMYDAQTHDPLFAPVDICQVVYTAVQNEDLYAATHRKPEDVTIDIDCERTFPTVDARMIEAAVMEMVRNGLRAVEVGGHVWVSVRSDKTHCYITVEDDGHGIAPEHWNVIWVPGKQLEHHMQRKKEGSGNGLETLRIIAERHGGKAILEWSEVGKGSRFLLKLPMR
jgi:signal transduction histidine kinase